MDNKNLNIKNIFSLAYENHRKNNFKLAEILYKKVLKINNKHLETIFFLGTLYLQIKNFEQAILLLNKAIEINPNNSNSYHNLGATYLELGEGQKALDLFIKVIKINPNHSDAYYNLGNSHKILGNFIMAKDSYEKSIKIQPNVSQVHNNLGNVFKDLGKLADAIQAYKTAIKIQPNHANAYHNLGNTFKEMGDFKKAEDSYNKAFTFQPTNLETLDTLCSLNKKKLDQTLLNHIKSVMKNKNLLQKDFAYGNFLLAKYALKSSNQEEEFNYLIEGHKNYFNHKKKYFNKGLDYWLNDVPQLKELMNLGQATEKIKNPNTIKPIFIIGVPRSGSTLVEKVLASGPLSIPIGEETGVISFYAAPNILAKKSIKLNIKNIYKNVVEKYKILNLINEKNDYIFTDKSLDNFFFIGLIKEIFPNAKFVNCIRNPMSSIMSILKNNLGDVAWAHDLKNIFKYFDIYYKKIDEFKKKFPKSIYDIQLENFVNNPEAESKKLMNFCNLKWDIKCLEYYKRNDLTSRTASNVQIRKPIYQDTKQKYYIYKQFLQKYSKKHFWFNE